jgi:mono/diheme cytochrome c family protein
MGARQTFVALALLAMVAACRQDMHDQPKLEPMEQSSFFADGRAARPRVAGTIARDDGDETSLFHSGKVGGKPSEQFPFAVTRDDLERGRERYTIFCAPCHAASGAGDGMVVQRGMKAPPSLHDPRLRAAPPGYFFDVITNGFGAMYDYSDRIAPRDRWLITAYIRALQLSQNASLADVPADARAELEKK